MCNHYRNIPGALHTIKSWADYISHFRLDDAAEDVWPGRQGAIVRVVDGAKVAETMHWGFPWEEVWFTVNDQPVSCFAGIWRQQEEGACYAFLTCEPNPVVKPVHPKAMPVILQPEDYDRWLSGDDAAALQAPFPSQLMAVVD